MSHDLDAEQHLGTQLRFILAPFEGRTIDDALVTEMTMTLNEELAFWLDGGHIRLVRETWGILG